VSAVSFGALAIKFAGRRKSKGDAENPTDPVRAYSWDVDDARAKPGKAIGDGSSGHYWAFTQALIAAFAELYTQHRLQGYEGPHKVQASYLPAFGALLGFLDGRTGDCFPAQETVGNKVGQTRSQVVRMIECAEYHGFLCHVRRSRKVEGAAGQARPQRAQASCAYFFDCERRMTREVFGVFWRKLMSNLKRLQGAGKRAAHFLKRAFNTVAQSAPRAQGKELVLALRRLELSVERQDAVGVSACPS